MLKHLNLDLQTSLLNLTCWSSLCFCFDLFSRVLRYEVVKCAVVYLSNFSMSDDMIIHFSSNSSNNSDQSLPTKIAKLEARMVGRDPSAVPATSTAPAAWSSASAPLKFAPAENLAELGTSSDSDDDVSQNIFISCSMQTVFLGFAIFLWFFVMPGICLWCYSFTK